MTGEKPAEQCRAGHDFRQHLIAERVQVEDRRMSRHHTVIGEGNVDVAAGKLARHEHHIARRHMHDYAHVALVGAYVGERVDT
jgi:hypothetical protein